MQAFSGAIGNDAPDCHLIDAIESSEDGLRGNTERGPETDSSDLIVGQLRLEPSTRRQGAARCSAASTFENRADELAGNAELSGQLLHGRLAGRVAAPNVPHLIVRDAPPGMFYSEPSRASLPDRILSIVKMRAGEEMIGADTYAVVATVTDVDAWGDRAIRHRIGESVGARCDRRAIGLCSAEASVSGAFQKGAAPLPAGVLAWQLFDATPEAHKHRDAAVVTVNEADGYAGHVAEGSIRAGRDGRRTTAPTQTESSGDLHA